MDAVFLKILNISLTASYVILFVTAARVFLKKAPKIFSYALWSAVLFRLTCPVSFTGMFSLFFINAAPIPENFGHAAVPRIATGSAPVDSLVNPLLATQAPPVNTVGSANPMQVFIFFGQFLWLLGIAALLVYSVISLLRLRHKLVGAARLEGNVYLADRIASPFVFGVLRPKIYLPSALPERERDYILAHERTHIRRLDHIVKLVAFLILCVHWFNPAVWLAFYLCGQDMELSCDEAVLKTMESDLRTEYSASLLGLATGRRFAVGTPLAFGEGDTKGRIKNIMHYKKPAFWVSVVALFAVAALCIGLATNPRPRQPPPTAEEPPVVSQPTAEPSEVTPFSPAPPEATQPTNEPWGEGADVPHNLGYTLPLPEEYRGKVTVTPPDKLFETTLFEVYHTASVAILPEAGFLFRIVRHTPAQFEDYWVWYEMSGGSNHFAKDDDYYYSMEFPTDVQSHPDVREEYGSLHAPLDAFIAANGLEPYDHYATVYAPEYTYPGEHALYQITLGSGDTFTAVLSKPVQQGDSGIWCVERMIQDNGNVHFAMPDTDLTAAEYYAQLQAEADAGTAPEWLFDPAAVGQEYFDRVWQWYPVHIKESELTYSDEP